MQSVIYLDSSFFDNLVDSAERLIAELNAVTVAARGDPPYARFGDSPVDPFTADQRAIISTKLRQIETASWWERMRHKYTVVTAAPVFRPELHGITRLDDTPESHALTGALLQPAGPFPPEAAADVRELSIVTVHKCDVLLSFKNATICNAFHQRAYTRLLRDLGYETPGIGTPRQLDYDIYDRAPSPDLLTCDISEADDPVEALHAQRVAMAEQHNCNPEAIMEDLRQRGEQARADRGSVIGHESKVRICSPWKSGVPRVSQTHSRPLAAWAGLHVHTQPLHQLSD